MLNATHSASRYLQALDARCVWMRRGRRALRLQPAHRWKYQRTDHRRIIRQLAHNERFIVFGVLEFYFPFHRVCNTSKTARIVLVLWTMAKIFSGMRPSGKLHLGNYLGAIKNWIDLQNQPDTTQCIFAAVDLHGITTPYDLKTFRNRFRMFCSIISPLVLIPQNHSSSANRVSPNTRNSCGYCPPSLPSAGWSACRMA